MRDYKIWNSDIGKIFIDRQNKEVGIDIEKQELEKPKLTREKFEEIGRNPNIDTKKFIEDYFKTHGTKDPFKQKKGIEKSDEYSTYSCSKCRNTFSDGDNVKSIKDFHLCEKCMQDLDFKDQDAVKAEREHFGKGLKKKTIAEYEREITRAYLSGDNEGAHKIEQELYSKYPKHAIGDISDKDNDYNQDR